MRAIALWLLGTMILAPSIAWGQADRVTPHAGYLYPAGGRQGSVFRVRVGGQNLRRVDGLHFTGAGVRAKVVRYMGGQVNLDRNQRRELAKRLAALAAPGRGDTKPPAVPATPDGGDSKPPAEKKVELPNHPLLKNLDQLGPEELEFIKREILRRDPKRQMNAQLAQNLLIEVTIDADAAPGDRELRLKSPRGLSNPLRFQVGALPEMLEPAPYERAAFDTRPIELPILCNGQIRPGDVDRFCFRAKAGQRLVFMVRARHLVPFLADAVPGWFQATLTLKDAANRELAHADDFRFDPDPVLLFRVPEDGLYKIEIQDSIYRGREDFVYRLSIGELPFVTSLFPAGARLGTQAAAAIDGWNLETKTIPLDTAPGASAIRRAVVVAGGGRSNEIPFAIDDLPEREEAEPNNTPKQAQSVDLPVVVNGRIGAAGDTDYFWFEGNAGDEIVAEVLARRLGSPVDSLLRLIDASGNVLAWNDDSADVEGHLHRDMGVLTHAADSRLAARLPADGVYRVRISDAQRHGGKAFVYRLRIGPRRPGFGLLVTPPTINVRVGSAAVIDVYALRKDGFAGDIEVVLDRPPAGFNIQGGIIPGGRSHVRMTLTAPRAPLAGPVILRVVGRARIGERVISRPAVPAENRMQAFLYRHLVPHRELVVAVLGTRRAAGKPIKVAGDGSIRIPAGGSTELRISLPTRARIKGLQFVLDDPPGGIVLAKQAFAPGRLTLTITASAEAKAGLAGNLIVAVFLERELRRGGRPTGRRQRVALGVLPAIPFEVVER